MPKRGHAVSSHIYIRKNKLPTDCSVGFHFQNSQYFTISSIIKPNHNRTFQFKFFMLISSLKFIRTVLSKFINVFPYKVEEKNNHFTKKFHVFDLKRVFISHGMKLHSCFMILCTCTFRLRVDLHP